MNKYVPRGITLLLVASLTADPCLAGAACSPWPCRQTSRNSELFEQQALTPISLWSGITSISRKLTGRTRRMMDRWLPERAYAEGLPGYERGDRTATFSWGTYFAENHNADGGGALEETPKVEGDLSQILSEALRGDLPIRDPKLRGEPLPPDVSEAMRGYYLEGVSLDEIGNRLNLSGNYVNHLLYRGRESLARWLGPSDFTPDQIKSTLDALRAAQEEAQNLAPYREWLVHYDAWFKDPTHVPEPLRLDAEPEAKNLKGEYFSDQVLSALAIPERFTSQRKWSFKIIPVLDPEYGMVLEIWDGGNPEDRLKRGFELAKTPMHRFLVGHVLPDGTGRRLELPEGRKSTWVHQHDHRALVALAYGYGPIDLTRVAWAHEVYVWDNTRYIKLTGFLGLNGKYSEVVLVFPPGTPAFDRLIPQITPEDLAAGNRSITWLDDKRRAVLKTVFPPVSTEGLWTTQTLDGAQTHILSRSTIPPSASKPRPYPKDFTPSKALAVLAASDWRIRVACANLAFGDFDFALMARFPELRDALRNQLVQRLKKLGWRIDLVAGQFNVTEPTIDLWMRMLDVRRDHLTSSEEVLSLVENADWNYVVFHSLLGIQKQKDVPAFFKTMGLQDVLRAKLVERQKIARGDTLRMSRFFRVPGTVVKQWMRACGIDDYKPVDAKTVLEFVEDAEWNYGGFRDTLHIRNQKDLPEYFEKIGLLEAFKAKLTERLEETQGDLARLGRLFGVPGYVVKQWMQVCGIDDYKPFNAADVVEQELEKLFQGDLLILAARHGRDIKNMVWGLIGSKLKGAYDQKKVDALIDAKLMQLIERTSEGRRVVPLTPAAPGEPSEAPQVFEAEPLNPAQIGALANRFEEALRRNATDEGMRAMVREQAQAFLFSLEEQYFFKHLYVQNPVSPVGEPAAQAIRQQIAREKESSQLVRDALAKLLLEIEETIPLEEELTAAGLGKKTFLNLYQLVAVNRMLAGKKFLLADEMGLGKTLESIVTFLMSRKKEMLVAAPKAGIPRWIEDLVDHTDTDIELVWLGRGGDAFQEELERVIAPNSRIKLKWIKSVAERRDYLLSQERSEPHGRRIMLVNYEALRQYNKHRENHGGPPVRVDFIAADEAHLLKKHTTDTARAIFGNGNGAGAIEAEYKLLLTGTPLENEPADLLGYFKYLSIGGTGPIEKMFQTMEVDAFSRVFAASNLATLSQLHGYLTAHMIRRLKEDVLQGLPRKDPVIASLNPYQRTMSLNGGKPIALEGDYRTQMELYETALRDPEEFERRFVNTSPEEEAPDEPALQLLRLQQAAIDPSLFGIKADSICFDAIKTLVKQRMDAGLSIVIFSDYSSVTRRLREMLSELYGPDEIAYIDGKERDTAHRSPRTDAVRRFQNIKARIMIATTGTSALAIELTQADSMIFVNNPWKPSVLRQAIDRAHRLSSLRRGKKILEIISLELDVPISIDRLKAAVLKRKSILAEMIVEGNFAREILDAFRESDSRVAGFIRSVSEQPVFLDNFELTRLERFREILKEIHKTTSLEARRRLWALAAPIYGQLVERKASLFANLGNLNELAAPEFSDLHRRRLKVVDAGSGPSTLYRAYERNRSEYERQGLLMDIVDYDWSEAMLAEGVVRPGGQMKGAMDDIGRAFEEGTVDVVNVSFSFRGTPHPAQFVQGVHKVLREGGLLTILLPETNVILDPFMKALQKSGFELRKGKEGTITKLKVRIKPEQYAALAQKFGKEFADDVAKEMEREFTYLVAKKAGVVTAPVTDGEFLVGRVVPAFTGKKAERLEQSHGEIRFTPETATVDSTVITVESPLPAALVIKTLRRLSGQVQRFIQWVDQRDAELRHSPEPDEDSAETSEPAQDPETAARLSALQTDLQAASESLSAVARAQLAAPLKTLQRRMGSRRWFRPHRSTLAPIVAALRSSLPRKLIERAASGGGISVFLLVVMKEGTFSISRLDPLSGLHGLLGHPFFWASALATVLIAGTLSRRIDRSAIYVHPSLKKALNALSFRSAA